MIIWKEREDGSRPNNSSLALEYVKTHDPLRLYEYNEMQMLRYMEEKGVDDV